MTSPFTPEQHEQMLNGQDPTPVVPVPTEVAPPDTPVAPPEVAPAVADPIHPALRSVQAMRGEVARYQAMVNELTQQVQQLQQQGTPVDPGSPAGPDPFAGFEPGVGAALKAALDAHLSPLQAQLKTQETLLQAQERQRQELQQHARMQELRGYHPNIDDTTAAFDAHPQFQGMTSDPLGKHLMVLGSQLADPDMHGEVLQHLLSVMPPEVVQQVVAPYTRQHAAAVLADHIRPSGPTVPTLAGVQPAAPVAPGNGDTPNYSIQEYRNLSPEKRQQYLDKVS